MTIAGRDGQMQRRVWRALVGLTLVMTGCAQIGADSPDDGGDYGRPPGSGDGSGSGGADAGPLAGVDGAAPGGDPDRPDAAPPSPAVTMDDFDDGDDDGWTHHGGSFGTWGGLYRLYNADTFGKSSWITPPDDVTIELDVRFDAGDGDAGAILRATDLGNGVDQMNGYYGAVNVSSDVAFFGRMDGSYTLLASAPVTIDRGTWYHLKIVASGAELRLYVGDMAAPKVIVVDSQWTSGAIGVRTYRSASSFDNVAITE